MANKILVIDDEELVRRLVSFNLSRAGYEVITCSSGPIGVVKAKEIYPDLIVVDRSMPLMDGYEFCEKIREDEELKDTPIIMLTAYETSIGDIKKAHELKLSGYIKKASDLSDLIARIDSFFEKEEQRFQDKSGPLSFYQRKHGAVVILPFYTPRSINRFEETIKILAEKNIKNIVLDLTRVKDIDDTLLEILADLRENQKSRLGDIKLYLIDVTKSLEISLNSYSLEYYKTVEDAMAVFTKADQESSAEPGS